MKNKVTDEELDILVSAYQDGSGDAAAQLVKHYQSYFQKLANAIGKDGYFHIDDRTQRSIITYFIRDDEVRKNANTMYKYSDYIRRVIYATLNNVKARYGLYDIDELKNEMIILFLSMASKHNFAAPFRIYIGQFFIRKFYKVMIRELVQNKFDTISYDEDDIQLAHFDTYDEDNLPRYYIEPTSPSEFDENWVNGFGCSELFKEFTIYQRRILKWYYEWKTLDPQALGPDIYQERKEQFKHTEDSIAERLGCSRKTINLKRNESKRKLTKLVTEFNLIEDSQSLPHI
jgi:hypothetical protein